MRPVPTPPSFAATLPDVVDRCPAPHPARPKRHGRTHRHTFSFRQFQEGEQVVDMAVNPAVRQKAEEVQRSSVLLHVVDGFEKVSFSKKLAVLGSLSSPGSDPDRRSGRPRYLSDPLRSCPSVPPAGRRPRRSPSEWCGDSRTSSGQNWAFSPGRRRSLRLFPEGKAVQNDQSHRFLAPAHRSPLPAASYLTERTAGSRLAPPTRAPSMSASARNAPMFSGFTLPPY